MKNTAIQWTDHTLNFWWGCTKISPACQHCYAESVAKVFGKRLFGTVPQWGAGKPRYERLEAARKEALAFNKEAGKCRVIDGRPWIDTGSSETVGQPESYRISGVPQDIKLKSRKLEDYRDFTRGEWESLPAWRPRVFVNSMSDWLDDEVPLGWLAYLLETIHLCPNLDFQLLTKRPENWKSRVLQCREHLPVGSPPSLMITHWAGFMLHGATPPPNVWIGTTVENQEWADKRIPHLLKIPAKVRFLSCEPLLGSISLIDIAGLLPLGCDRDHDHDGNCDRHREGCPKPLIHWVIAGGESGGKARPTHPDWLRILRDECFQTGVPFHLKQWGEWIAVDNIRHCTSEKARLDKGYPGHKFDDGTLMLRLGTDHTGNNLDGKFHAAFPA